MIICEFGFDVPDPDRPEYSFREVDYYAFVPYISQMVFRLRNHRLSLRKNLKTGDFEVYRFYFDTKEEEVVFRGKFKEALNFADNEWNRVWGCVAGVKKESDQPCKHYPPEIDTVFCPYIDRY